jgi:hypothetical protein
VFSCAETSNLRSDSRLLQIGRPGSQVSYDIAKQGELIAAISALVASFNAPFSDESSPPFCTLIRVGPEGGHSHPPHVHASMLLQ